MATCWDLDTITWISNNCTINEQHSTKYSWKHDVSNSFWFTDQTTWTFSGIHLHNRIVRSKIQRVYPRLLMANSLTQINLEVSQNDFNYFIVV